MESQSDMQQLLHETKCGLITRIDSERGEATRGGIRAVKALTLAAGGRFQN